MMSEARLSRDRQIATMMIGRYCQAKHASTGALCNDCLALEQYAHTRLERCPHGDAKPMCHECTIHCYKPDMRSRITDVMRVIGPMMRKGPVSGPAVQSAQPV